MLGYHALWDNAVRVSFTVSRMSMLMVLAHALQPGFGAPQDKSIRGAGMCWTMQRSMRWC